jgi:hypothetical protein
MPHPAESPPSELARVIDQAIERAAASVGGCALVVTVVTHDDPKPAPQPTPRPAPAPAPRRRFGREGW